MRIRHYDDWTVETDEIEPVPALWKDVTLASVVAAVFWGAAAVLLI